MLIPRLPFSALPYCLCLIDVTLARLRRRFLAVFLSASVRESSGSASLPLQSQPASIFLHGFEMQATSDTQYVRTRHIHSFCAWNEP